MMMTPPVRLPGDIEQKLLDGHRVHATLDLMQQRGITPEGARMLVERWLFERHHLHRAGSGPAKAVTPDGEPPADTVAARPALP